MFKLKFVSLENIIITETFFHKAGSTNSNKNWYSSNEEIEQNI